MAVFTRFLPQLFALYLSTLLNSGQSLLNQSFLSPLRSRSLFLALTSRSTATLKTLSSSLLTTSPYHLTPFAIAFLSSVSFPNRPIFSSIVFVSTTFQPNMVLTVARSVLHKIAFPFLLKTLPHVMADPTQQR